MKDTEKNEEKNNINIDNKNEDKEKIENIENGETTKPRIIGTVGNFVLTALVILIVGTGALTYYLVNNARKDLENELGESVVTSNNVLNYEYVDEKEIEMQ